MDMLVFRMICSRKVPTCNDTDSTAKYLVPAPNQSRSRCQMKSLFFVMVWNPKQFSNIYQNIYQKLPNKTLEPRKWQEKQHLSDGGVDVDLVLPLKFRPHGAEGELIDPRS